MLHFLASDAGWVVLFAPVDAIWRGDVRAQKFDAIARLCGVSRPQVRALFTKAGEYGLITETAPGLYAPTPAFLNVVHAWISECLAAFVSCCRLARDLAPADKAP
jgi:hypothetical protein